MPCRDTPGSSSSSPDVEPRELPPHLLAARRRLLASRDVVPVPLAGSIAMLRRMKACPHRSTPANCGCGVATCGLGKGRAGKVNHAECYECLNEES